MATLSSVKHYLEARSRASLEDIAIGLETSPEAARALLDRWLEKNRVRRIEACGPCGHKAGSCSCGHAATIEVYEWIRPEEEPGHGAA